MTISGTVTDAAGAPIQSAAVSISALSISTRTSADGRYAFIIRQAQVMGQTVNMTARHGRYGAQVVQIQIVGGSLEQNFVLGAVVPPGRPPGDTTPLPRAVQPRAPGVAAPRRIIRFPGHIVGHDPWTSGPTDFVSALAGQHAALRVNTANTPDGSASMLFRGRRSFLNTTAPLVVVDGIPMDNETFTSAGQRFGLGGFDFGSPLNDLALDDIASVDLMDPVTATLRYGSRAANGVLEVWTKRAGVVSGFAISATTRFSGQSAAKLPAFQNQFGQGLGGAYEFFDGQGGGINDAVAESWGPRLDARPIVQHSLSEPRRPDVRHFLPQPDDIERFYGGASTLDANVALFGGREQGSMRLALNARTASGLTPGADMRRLGGTFVGETRIARRLTAILDARLTGTFADQRPGSGFDEVNPAAAFTRMGRQVDLDALKTNVTDENGEQINWIYTDRNNPWFASTRNDNHSDRRHFTGRLSLMYDVTPWLAATLTGSTDDWLETRLVTVADGWLGGFPTTLGRRDFPDGGSDNQTVGATETLFTFGLNARQRTFNTYGLAASVGGELRANEFTTTTVVTDTRSGELTNAERRGTHDVSAYFASAAASRGALRLEGGVRVEQSSSLPKSYSAVFPSAQATYDVGRGIPALRDALHLGDTRLVARWWRAGNEITERTLATAFFGGSVSAPDSAVIGPERTQGLELGFHISSPQRDGFQGSRFGLDVVAYRERSTNLLGVFLPGDGSASLAQVGEIFNGGVRGKLAGNLVEDWHGLGGGFALSVARNRGTVDAVHASATEIALSPTTFGSRLAARVGGEAGVIVGSRYLRAENGSLLLRSGLPIPDANAPFSVLGSVHPDWTASLDTRWHYRGVLLTLLFDARIGGKVFSATNMRGSYAGTLESTLIGDRAPGAAAGDSLTIAGIDSVTGAANTTRVSAEQYFHALGAIAEPWVYDATFTKLREATLSYVVPTRFLPGFREHSLRVSLVGRNMLTWADAPNIDPEMTAFSGFEMGQLPTARSIGLQVTIAP